MQTQDANSQDENNAEPTVADYLGSYSSRVRQNLENLLHQGKQRGAELSDRIEPLVNDVRSGSKAYAEKLESTVGSSWNAAREKDHLGYVMITSGWDTLYGGIQEVMKAKPSEIGWKHGLGYAGRILLGAAVAGIGLPVYVFEETIRYLLGKRPTQ